MSELPKEVIEFLVQERTNEVQQEGDFTAEDAATLWNASRNTALKQLHRLAKEGKVLEFHGKLLTGKMGYFYRMPGDQSKPL